MRIVEIDAKQWKSSLDFLRALFDGIEQGYPHGLSVDAFVDSMIWRGMGGIEPPYAVQIVNLKDAPREVKNEVSLMISSIMEARLERLESQGVDVEVSISAPDISD